MTLRPKRVWYAASVLVVAGLGICAFGISFPLVNVPAGGGLEAPNFYWYWAVFFLVVGSIHLIAGVGVTRGRQWALWLGMTILLGGSLLGAYTLARALSYITRYMDVPGTIGLAVVTGLYALAGWSLLSSRQWFTKQALPSVAPVTQKRN